MTVPKLSDELQAALNLAADEFLEGHGRDISVYDMGQAIQAHCRSFAREVIDIAFDTDCTYDEFLRTEN